MERIKRLNRFQKGILLFMIGMAVVFFAVYCRTISQVGFAYKDAILVPGQQNGSTVYSGKINGRPASFTVAQDRTVVFRYGDTTFGPYTAKEDPAAVPKDPEIAEGMVGIELRKGDSVLFRGGVLALGGDYWLYNEDGTAYSFDIIFETDYGVMQDENGNEIDPVEPSATAILHLMNGPELTHKGTWLGWLAGVFVCGLNAVLILFADELFRLNLAFQIRNAEDAEPSDWEIISRYIGWNILAVMALAIFIMGLQ